MTRGRHNVLVSSAGRRVSLLEHFRESIAALGTGGRVLATDISMFSSAFHRADEAFLVPRCTSDEFVPKLLALCDAHDVGLVVPTIDTELAALAAAREQFLAIGTTVAVSGPATVAIGADKVATNAWLVEGGFPTVRQSDVASVLADPGAWSFPVVAKPSAGSASIGVHVVESADELQPLEAAAGYVVEERATGDELSIDVLVGASGAVRDAVVRRRIEVRGGEVSKGVTVRDPEVIALAVSLGEALPDAYGVLTVQLFLDPIDRTMRVIEINPRFGGGFPLAWQAGARFPQWMLEELEGVPSTCTPAAWRDGLVMLRYDDAVFVDSSDLER
ncbi:MAG: ATP-grasp domain-containing protein [Acidimicrobiia bacterium]